MPFNEPIDLSKYDIDGAFALDIVRYGAAIVLWPRVHVSPGRFRRSLNPYLESGPISVDMITHCISRVRNKHGLVPMDEQTAQSGWDDVAGLLNFRSWKDFAHVRPRGIVATFYRTPSRNPGFYQMVPAWDRRRGNGLDVAKDSKRRDLEAGTRDDIAIKEFVVFFESLMSVEPDEKV